MLRYVLVKINISWLLSNYDTFAYDPLDIEDSLQVVQQYDCLVKDLPADLEVMCDSLVRTTRVLLEYVQLGYDEDEQPSLLHVEMEQLQQVNKPRKHIQKAKSDQKKTATPNRKIVPGVGVVISPLKTITPFKQISPSKQISQNSSMTTVNSEQNNGRRLNIKYPVYNSDRKLNT